MNQEEHLNKIVAKCRENIGFYGCGKTFPAIPDSLLKAAEAGWRATIAAIIPLLSLVGTGMQQRTIESIIAAWPEELL